MSSVLLPLRRGRGRQRGELERGVLDGEGEVEGRVGEGKVGWGGGGIGEGKVGWGGGGIGEGKVGWGGGGREESWRGEGWRGRGK